MKASLFSLFFAGAALALPKVTRTGQYLYDESGNRFFIKVSHPLPTRRCALVLIPVTPRVSHTRRRARLARPPTEASPSPSTLSYVPSFLLLLFFIHPLPIGRVSIHSAPWLFLTLPRLADPAGCKRDIANLQKLTVNAVRVYSVDAALNHDDCMSQLSAAGIYTMFVLSSCSTCRLATERLSLASTCPSPSMAPSVTPNFLLSYTIFDAHFQAVPLPLGPQIF